MPIWSAGGRSLHYLDAGEGPAVVMLHAFPLSSASLPPQIEALQSRFRCLAPDVPGFGGSSRTPEDEATEMSTVAELVLGLLDHLGISQAVVGGVSMGGYLAMAMVAEAPARIRGLWLADTQATADDEQAKQGRRGLLEALKVQGIEALVERNVPKLLSAHAPPELKAKVEGWARAASVPAVKSATLGLMARPDSRHILSRFAGPTLVLVGAEDTITPPAKAKQMTELVAGAQLVEIPAAGHLSHLEQPGSFNAALEAFLSRIA